MLDFLKRKVLKNKKEYDREHRTYYTTNRFTRLTKNGGIIPCCPC